MEYARKHLSHINFFMAEQIFSIFLESNYDFLTIEDRLADYSDCIIIVLESNGAFAELGAFTIKDELAKIVLVINDYEFKKSDSFINYGPIAKVNQISKFKPTIYTNLNSILSIAPDIGERLEKIERKKNKRIDLSSFEKFNLCSAKVKMLFILDLIALCSPINYRELIDLLKSLYGDENFEIKIDISLLEALKLIHRTDNGYYVRNIVDKNMFYEFKGINEVFVRALIINYYHKYYRDKLKLLKSRSGLS